MADGTGDIHLGKKICSVCHGSGRIIGIYGENEPCPYCNGEGTTDTY
jgi:DnaJ-class molecular chaperone